MNLFTKRIFISDLPPNITEEDIKEKFSKFGSVSSLEIKQRKQITIKNKYPTYAYINLNIDNYSLQQCFEHFAKNKWKGNNVEIQIAKENFLERLKQERESDKLLKTVEEKVTPVKDISNKPFNRKRFHSSDSSNDDSEKEQISFKKIRSTPNVEKKLDSPQAENQTLNNKVNKQNNTVNNINNKKDKNIDEKQQKVTAIAEKEQISFKKIRSTPKVEKEMDSRQTENQTLNNKHNNTINNINNKKDKNIDEKQQKVTAIADQKRLNSIMEMKKIYQQKKNAIKIALMNVDTKPNNKVIFNDKDYEEDYTTDRRDERNQSKSDKKVLFQDDDEDDMEYNFDVQEQFQGKKGKKLMELQLKFKNDKRFKMDDRFLEDEQASEIVEDQQDKINDKESTHSVDQDEDNMEVTAEEKQKELSILEGVLGKKLGKSTDKEVKKTNKSIGMVRYDPTNPEHNKYLLKQDNQITRKLKKKREKQNSEAYESERPEVSKETFYEVKADLKEALNEDKSFSMLKLFGSNIESGNTEVDLEITQNDQSGQGNSFKTNEKNPFRYDSSDEGSDHEDASNQIDNGTETNEVTNQNNGQNVSLGPTKLWREPFFFRKDDYRFQEGIDFVRRFALDDKEEFIQVRRNIKEIVKAKVRNNLRKNKPFRKKLGGRRMIKIKKAIKNR